MKLDNSEDKLVPDVSITLQQEKEIKQKLVGRLVPHKGHTIFEINFVTGECKPAEIIQNETAALTTSKKLSKPQSIGKVVINKDCVYVSAMNKKNALKHLQKLSNGSKR